MEIKSFNNNGVNISYVKSGQGQPIILIHGNTESNIIFGEIIDLLSENFTVYAPDTRCHGKSDKVKKLNYIDIADDISQLVKHENISNPIFFGFSDGGIVGLLLAIKYQYLLKKLLIAGINLTPKGIKPFWRFLMHLAYCITFSDKTHLILKQPNITIEMLKNIKTPTTVFYAEKDIVKFSHSQAVADNVENAKLVFIAKENHGSYVLDNKKLYTILKEHL